MSAIFFASFDDSRVAAERQRDLLVGLGVNPELEMRLPLGFGFEGPRVPFGLGKPVGAVDFDLGVGLGAEEFVGEPPAFRVGLPIFGNPNRIGFFIFRFLRGERGDETG
jgi:hypothetical protein